MNIALIGYGKMGKTIEKIALERGHKITARVQIDDWVAFEKTHPSDIDVAIEFSQPEAAVANITRCLLLGIPVISGTTGWLDQKDEIESLCLENGGTFFYASNFSIGVNIFFEINELVAKMMNRFPDYQIQMEEIHHIHKKDSPSGTAITLAEGIFDNHRTTNNWVETADSTTAKPTQLPIKSIREKEVPGTHTIHYSSNVDTITLQHEAHSRDGFALGAVLVAEWIQNKKGVLSMKDFMKS
jgi:4-hydroxy-tetrahydrodipicolinate reductase